MKKKLLSSIIVLSIFGILVYGINNYFDNNDNNISTLAISSDFPSTSSIEDMINQSDLIVVGTYEGFDSSWNMARNPQDITKDDPDNYVEGHLYNFNVNEILKGSLEEDIIKINHRYYEIIDITDSDVETNSEGIIIKEAKNKTEKKYKITDPLYIKPELNTKYVLFLKENKELQNYYGSIEPFSIKLDEKNISKLQSNLIKMDKSKLTDEIKIGDTTINIVNQVDAEVQDNISGKSLKEIKEIIKANSK